MKIQELVENKDVKHQLTSEAYKLMDELVDKIIDELSDHPDLQFDLTKEKINETKIKIKNLEKNLADLTLSFEIRSYIVNGKQQPTADANLILDVGKGTRFSKTIKNLLTKLFKTNGMHLGWSTSPPWVFDNFSRDTASFVLKSFKEHATDLKIGSDSGVRYDPRGEFNNRPGEAARQARVSRSAYSSSFGGDSSNYKK